MLTLDEYVLPHEKYIFHLEKYIFPLEKYTYKAKLHCIVVERILGGAITTLILCNNICKRKEDQMSFT